MRSLWARHPRYVIALGLILATTVYLLGPYHIIPVPPPFEPAESYSYGGHSTEARVNRAEAIYSKIVNDRQGMMKKFGPDPNDIYAFPPNREPWPPYTVWDFFPAAYNCPHELERVGALGDGGKWLCGLSRVAKKKDCVIYSVGINNESSYEAEILSRTDYCEVWGYDFTVDSMGPQIHPSLRHRTHFKPFGLAGIDAHGSDDGNKMYTLGSLMRMNGHNFIDILKIDIEGWEFDTLTTLIKSYLETDEPLPFGQLQLEIHIWDRSFKEFLTWWEMLEAAGLRPFMTEPNLVYQNYNRDRNSDLAEYSFLNIKGRNVFITDY